MRNRGFERQTGLESSESGLSAAFLEVGERCVEKEQSRDDSSFAVLVQDDLKYDGRFKKPRYRSPKLSQCIA